MYTINRNSLMKMKEISKDNCYVVADFDKTISTKESNTTLSLFSKSGLYGEEYAQERNQNYQYYRPLELDLSISSEDRYYLMKEWQEKSYQLMLKYKVRESDIAKILARKDLLDLREGAIEFIATLNRLNIPLIINSAGCGNFIIDLLRMHGIYNDNIYVYSNILEFEDDVIIDTIDDIIHSMNKYNIVLPEEYRAKIEDKKYVIVIGDAISDIEMTLNLPKEETLAFGFLESNVEEMRDAFNENYDVVLENKESFDTIRKILKLEG